MANTERQQEQAVATPVEVVAEQQGETTMTVNWKFTETGVPGKLLLTGLSAFIDDIKRADVEDLCVKNEYGRIVYTVSVSNTLATAMSPTGLNINQADVAKTYDGKVIQGNILSNIDKDVTTAAKAVIAASKYLDIVLAKVSGCAATAVEAVEAHRN